MRRMMWAAVAVAVMALGAAGCGTSDADTGVSAAPVTASPQPRPASTGPLTKEVVRADLDTSAADAGLPANVPEYAGMYEDAEAGTLQVCGIGFTDRFRMRSACRLAAGDIRGQGLRGVR